MCKQCGLPTGAGEDYYLVDEDFEPEEMGDIQYIEYFKCDECGARGKLVSRQNKFNELTGRYFEEPENEVYY